MSEKESDRAKILLWYMYAQDIMGLHAGHYE